MAKSNAERQRLYILRKKEKGEYNEVKINNRDKQARCRGLKKRDAKGQQLIKEKNRINKQNQRLSERRNARSNKGNKEGSVKPTTSAFASRQFYGKCVKRIRDALLPLNPEQRKEILIDIAKENGVDIRNVTPPLHRRNPRALSSEVEDAVRQYYEEDAVSYQCPGREDCRKVQINGKIVLKPLRYLVLTLKEAYASFREENENMCIGLTKFCELRPPHVRLQKDIPHNVCTCVIHENVRYLLVSLQRKGIPLSPVFRDFISQVVCDQNSEKCMEGNCADCPGLKFLQVDDNIANESCEWQLWSTDNDGYATLKTENGTLLDALISLENSLANFLKYTYVKREQSAFFKEARENVDLKTCFVQVDYAENYSCKRQNEIQSAYWGTKMVSIFTSVVWYRSKNDNTVQSKSFALVSDCIQHDKYSVYVCLLTLIGEILCENPDFERLIFFSDGAASQFKQRYTMFVLTYLATVFDIGIGWNFFESYHGKGVVDAVGGSLKQMVWMAVKSGKNVNNAADFIAICEDKRSKIRVIEIPEDDILKCKGFLDRKWRNITPIPQTHAAHHVKVVGTGKIEYAQLSKNQSKRRIHKFC